MRKSQPELAFLHDLADAAEKATLPRFRGAFDVADKAAPGGRYDPVTIADREAEAAMRALIAARFPGHGVIGEEYGEAGGRDAFVLDPIDGTRAFIAGLPLWGTLIGVRRDGRPALGLLAQPYLRERFSGDGASATLERPGEAPRGLATRACETLGAAILSTTDPFLFAPGAERDGFERLRAEVRLARYGYDCYAYAMLALGLIDLVVEAGLRPFDIEPLVPIVEGAGGAVTDWAGGSDLASGRVVAAGDRRLIAPVVKLLESQAA